MTKKRKKKSGIPLILKQKFSIKMLDKLGDASDLISENQLSQAAKILEPLYIEFPRESQVVKTLAILRFHQEDLNEALKLIRKSLLLAPHDAATHLMMVGLEVDLGYFALAYEDLRAMRVTKLDSTIRADYQRLHHTLEQFKDSIGRDDLALTDKDHLIHLEALNDRCALNVRNGNFRQAEKNARDLLELEPSSLRAFNNLSEILFQQSDMEGSLHEARRALAVAPENQFAIALALRVSYLLGELDKVNLQVDPTLSAHHYAKQLDAQLFKGDLDAIVAWREQLVSFPDDGDFSRTAALRLLACVLLKKELFQEAQDVIALMAAEKRGTVTNVGVGLNTVLPVALLSGLGSAEREEQVKVVMKQPWFIRATTFLIRFGDVPAIACALSAAEDLLLPDYIPALTEFVAEDRGTEELRLQAMRCIDEINGETGSRHVVFFKGKKSDIESSKILVRRDATVAPSDPRLEKIYEEVIKLANLGKTDKVGALMAEAAKLGDKSCSLRFNYAVCLLGSGKVAEGRALIEALHAEDPEYLFARTFLAQTAAEEGRIDEARALLEPLLSRTELHVTEYRSLVAAQVILALEIGEIEVAKGSIEALEQVVEKGDRVLADLKWRVERVGRKVVGG